MTEELKPRQATPEDELREHLMDPRIAKTEIEWFAAREIKRLEELLATRSPAWRDIESAPRDGSVIMLWSLSAELPVLGFWSEEDGAWRPAILVRDYSGYGEMANAGNVDASRWQDLPLPPEEGK